MSALGPCPTDSQIQQPNIVVNEVSTVASVYALAGFLTNATSVASSGSAEAHVGLLNAFKTRYNLVDPDGVARQTTLAGNGYLIANVLYGVNGSGQSIINQLANLLYPCVIGSGSASAQCRDLMKAATPSAANGCTNAARPTDTVSVLRNIIDQTDCNVGALYSLSTQAASFQPDLQGPPNDWSLPIQYNTHSLDPYPVPANTGLPAIWFTPRFIAVDSQGNVWFTNSGTGLEKLGPQGQELTIVADGRDPEFLNALPQTYGLAIDQQDNVWATSLVTNILVEFSSLGVPLSGPNGYPTPATLASQTNGALAIDSSDDVWLLTLDGYLCNYAGKDGSQRCPSSGAYNLGTDPKDNDRNSLGLAIDKDNHVWFAVHGYDLAVGKSVGAVGMVVPGSAKAKPYVFPAPNLWQNPMFLSSNRNGHIWVSNQSGGTTATLFNGKITIHYRSNLVAFQFDPKTNQATPLNGSPILGDLANAPVPSGLCMPRASMFDGNDSLWVGDYTEPDFPANPCGESLSHFKEDRGRITGRGIGHDFLKKTSKPTIGQPHPVQQAGGSGSTVGSNDFDEPFGLAIDPSGNIWIADGQSYIITELVGAAAPVVTPLSPKHLGQKP
jgi:streptogramin lyase